MFHSPTRKRNSNNNGSGMSPSIRDSSKVNNKNNDSADKNSNNARGKNYLHRLRHSRSFPSILATLTQPLNTRSSTRRLALLTVIICMISSITVILISGNGNVSYHYNNYSYETIINTAFLNDDEQSEATRQKAIDKAIEETNNWSKIAQNDELEMNKIIRNYKEEERALKKQKEEEQKKTQMEQANTENNEYYLYYQDDDDQSSTVIGMPLPSKDVPSSADPTPYIIRFVLSLRRTGFTGNIIVGLENVDTMSGNDAADGDNATSTTYIETSELREFLKEYKVTVKRLIPVVCTFQFAKPNQKCYLPYSHIKREWSYFPLARDWLTSCEECIGSVIIAPIRDTVFQRNPFGRGMPIIQRLHLFEQHPKTRARDTSAGVLLNACDNINIDKILVETLEQQQHYIMKDRKRLKILSASIAVGTRDDIIDYLGAVHTVMREWMHRSQCHFEHSTSDDGMAIANYLRLKKRLPFRTRIIPHRTGIVNNVGFDGRAIYEAHLYLGKFKGLSEDEAGKQPYVDESEKGWLDSEYLLTDVDGNLIDVFYQQSAIICEYNSFGPPFVNWFDNKYNLTQAINDSSKKKTASIESISERDTGSDAEGVGGKGIILGGVSESNEDADKDNVNAIGNSTSTTNGNGTDTGNTTHTGIETGNTTKVNTDMESDGVNTDSNSETIDIGAADNTDYYYIKQNDEESVTSNSTSTTASARKVDKDATDLLGNGELNTMKATKVEVEAKKEKEQPMYYKDPTIEDLNATASVEGVDADLNVENKSFQVVPVEETLISKLREHIQKMNDEKEKLNTESAEESAEESTEDLRTRKIRDEKDIKEKLLKKLDEYKDGDKSSAEESPEFITLQKIKHEEGEGEEEEDTEIYSRQTAIGMEDSESTGELIGLAGESTEEVRTHKKL